MGGLHKSMTRLSSSQQINNAAVVGSTTSTNHNPSHSSGNVAQLGGVSGGAASPSPSNYVTPVPPLSSNVIITGHNKWGIPSTKITSGGVTVTTSPTRTLRPHSQGPSTLLMSGSNGGLGSITSCNNPYNITNGNVISGPANNVNSSLDVPSAASPTSSVMTLPVNANNVRIFMGMVALRTVVIMNCPFILGLWE